VGALYVEYAERGNEYDLLFIFSLLSDADAAAYGGDEL